MRTTRKWSEASRQKLSASTKGKPKSDTTKERIRQSMIRYWQTIPSEVTEQAKQPNIMSLEKSTKGIPVHKIKVPERLLNPQEVPPEPTIENDFGLWEEITKDFITYQGKGNAKKANNKQDSNGRKC